MDCLEIVLTALLTLNPSWSDAKAELYAKPICVEAEKSDIDPLIAVAVMRHETNFRPNLKHKNKNGSVDYGLMQFNCKQDMSKINMKWRRRICDPKRRKYLMTIKGNIKAGFAEMSFWKKICRKKHAGTHFLYLDLDSDCLDCASVPLVLSIYGDLTREWHLTDVLKSHWWMKHYNWNSKTHWLSVMYIYKILLERRSENYVMVRTDYYRKLAKSGMLKECLSRDDMCLGEYEKWQTRQKEKKLKQRRPLKRKSESSRKS